MSPHLDNTGDVAGALGITLVWLEHAPNIAAAMTVLWFAYRFIKEIVSWIRDRNSK